MNNRLRAYHISDSEEPRAKRMQRRMNEEKLADMRKSIDRLMSIVCKQEASNEDVIEAFKLVSQLKNAFAILRDLLDIPVDAAQRVAKCLKARQVYEHEGLWVAECPSCHGPVETLRISETISGRIAIGCVIGCPLVLILAALEGVFWDDFPDNAFTPFPSNPKIHHSLLTLELAAQKIYNPR